MRRFQGERVASIMERLKIPDEMPIEHKWVTNAVERAQRQVESQNFEIRKNVLQYDEVMNRQREVIYKWRAGILHGESTSDLIHEWIEETVEGTVVGSLGTDTGPADWDWDELNTALSVYYQSELGRDSFEGRIGLDDVVEQAIDDARHAYTEREKELGADVLSQVERSVMLTVIDNKWREHLAEMDYLRAGIGLRAMGQRDPLTEYQREAFDTFGDLVDAVKSESVRYVYKAQVTRPETTPPARVEPHKQASHTPVSAEKVGRNAPCPCGSGKKYKYCHGAA